MYESYGNGEPQVPDATPFSGRRKALLVGVKTTRNLGTNFRDITGAHRDTNIMRKILVDKYDYDERDITVLIDNDDVDQSSWPTKANIVSAMEQLVSDAQPGDHLVFHFSGHGGQICAVHDHSEEDGLDEILFPTDAGRLNEDDNTAEPDIIPYTNYIKDDLIGDTFKSLPGGVHCVLFFDCCNSGTAADLPAIPDDPSGVEHSKAYRAAGSNSMGFLKVQTVHRPKQGLPPDEINDRYALDESPDLPTPNLCSWGACKDGQQAFGTNKGGVFIRALRDALNANPTLTNGVLLHSLPDQINKIIPEDVRDKLESKGQLPIPQLGSLRPDTVLKSAFTL
ncbi:peptidase C14 [Trametes maxima]|nr:peptidase C14 [Trametes maxima]